MPLPRVYKVVTDQQGNIVPQVLGSVFNQGTAVLASLYQDDAGTIPLSNPMTSDAQYGSFKFYLHPGHYDLSFTKPGYTFESIQDFQVPNDAVMLGTMSAQNANAVAITGGTIVGLGGLQSSNAGFGVPTEVGYSLAANLAHLTGGVITGLSQLESSNAGFGTPTVGGYTLVTNPAGKISLGGDVAIGQATTTNARLEVSYNKATQYGLRLHQVGVDVGGVFPVTFTNIANTEIGSISSTATNVAYNTSSDGRLKEAIAALPDALATILALRPVQFRWKQDGSPGQGFVAQEVQAVVPLAVTGAADSPAPSMQMDLSRLVPHLVGAVQTLAAQVAALTARLEAAGA